MTLEWLQTDFDFGVWESDSKVVKGVRYCVALNPDNDTYEIDMYIGSKELLSIEYYSEYKDETFAFAEDLEKIMALAKGEKNDILH